VFEVDIDGQRVFSKKKLGRHADPKEILDILRKRAQK
jgi:hypothetical protein